MILLINSCFDEPARSKHDAIELFPDRAAGFARLSVDDGSNRDSVESTGAPITRTTDVAGQNCLVLYDGIANAVRRGVFNGLADARDHAAYGDRLRSLIDYLTKMPPEWLQSRHQYRRHPRH